VLPRTCRLPPRRTRPASPSACTSTVGTTSAPPDADIEDHRLVLTSSRNVLEKPLDGALALLSAHAEEVTALNGWDTLTFFGLASGAKGTVWGATNVIPELSMQLWDAVAVRGDLEEGPELWAKIWPICSFLESCNYAAAVKTRLELIGHPAGPARAPFSLLGDDARARFSELLRAAGAA
jgi:dihydrodipicolinate synthase/N-acetylneuraminate lyase